MSAQAARPVFVYYWIPGDNDEVDHPNAFQVMQTGAGVKLRDIRARFPLPGTYHFRFRMRWESGHVWMDVTNEDSMVPIFEDRIIAKVLRVSWTGAEGPGNAAGNAAAGRASPPAASPTPSAPTPTPSPPPRPQAPSPPEDMLNFGDSPGHAVSPPVKPRTDEFDMLFS